MQLVTRLLRRLLVVGAAMMAVAMALTLWSAKRNIADEVDSSQRIGQLMATIASLQEQGGVAGQAAAIDALNDGDTLRHFHVDLFDQQGRRLTRPARQQSPQTGSWLERWMLDDLSTSTYTLSVVQPDGQRLSVVLAPTPQAESSEALSSAWLQLGLFGAIAVALIIALWFSVRHALAPLGGILHGISRIEAGDYATRIAASGTRELNQIAQALNHLASALTEQIATRRELLHRLQDVQEEERRRLAHELHDEFGQRLTAIQVDASYLLRQTAGQPALEACAQAMHENSGHILAQLRGLLAQLRPYGLQGDEEHEIALEQALRDLVRQRQARGDAALDCRLSVALGKAVVPPRLAVAIYRIAQEALTNVMRHAQASRADLGLQWEEASSMLVLTVADDGIGLQAADDSKAGGGLGLTGIRERVLAHHGVLDLRRGDPRGLVLEARFPLGDGGGRV